MDMCNVEQDAGGGVPKVTANKMIETRGGTWLLPFWHERALLGRSRACAALQGVPAAGVLRSTDQCERTDNT